MSDHIPSTERSWWTITVSGYGAFEYFGTETEAEDMRRHKAEWEGGRGRKRPSSPEEAAAGLDALKMMHAQGYPLDERESEALR